MYIDIVLEMGLGRRLSSCMIISKYKKSDIYFFINYNVFWDYSTVVSGGQLFFCNSRVNKVSLILSEAYSMLNLN